MQTPNPKSIAAPQLRLQWVRRAMSFFGPGYLVAVGYMDPGNWATNLAGGSRFGYSLLWVILVSNFMALVLQVLSIRLGVVTGRDLAQACRESSSSKSAIAQWVVCEIAICATDLAEMIGMAIALNLLFGIPLLPGIVLTSLDVLVVLALQKHHFRVLESLVIALIGVIFVCFWINLNYAQPNLQGVIHGILPNSQVFHDPQMLYVAMGIIGATVMPHNLYLHSSAVQTRQYLESQTGKPLAIRLAVADISIALFFAFLINSAILVTSAAVFHVIGRTEVTELTEAYKMLAPLLGTPVASVLFAVALLAAGQSSAITATLAGQVVMEGYTSFRLSPWIRRLVTRLAALLPALITVAVFGSQAITKLLILSQVILSLQLPFAIAPLIRFTGDHTKMGSYVNPKWLTGIAYLSFAIILILNAKLLFDLIFA